MRVLCIYQGRDEIVEAAVSGIATYECTSYNASVLYIAGLLQAGSEGNTPDLYSYKRVVLNDS